MDSKGYVFDVNIESSVPVAGSRRMKFDPEPKIISHISDKLRSESITDNVQPPMYRALLHIDNAQSKYQTKVCTDHDSH